MHLLVARRFLLREMVGTGSTGPVRRAWDLRDRRQVVVKRGGAGPDLDHPHLLPGRRVGDLVVLPLVRGGSAEQLLASRGILPAERVAGLLDQLLEALSALHEAGWVHGDVKPGNLLLEPTEAGPPHLWLADLGSARRIGAPGPPDGTAGYVAPEARAGAPAHPRADLFAAGVTAAELLTGRPPRRPDDLPRGRLRPLLTALIAVDPDRRPESASKARALLEVGAAQRP
jgi:serine/threonine-protein kinase